MIFTIGALYYLLANSMNLTSPINYITPMNFTTSTIISDSVNYTQSMLKSFTMEPYRNHLIILQERLQSDPSALILFTYGLSFFMIASMLCMFKNRTRTQNVVIKSYNYESEDDEVEDENNDDLDYTFNIYVRNRKVKWTPHPMIRRSMDSSQKIN